MFSLQYNMAYSCTIRICNLNNTIKYVILKNKILLKCDLWHSKDFKKSSSLFGTVYVNYYVPFRRQTRVQCLLPSESIETASRAGRSKQGGPKQAVHSWQLQLLLTWKSCLVCGWRSLNAKTGLTVHFPSHELPHAEDQWPSRRMRLSGEKGIYKKKVFHSQGHVYMVPAEVSRRVLVA